MTKQIDNVNYGLEKIFAEAKDFLTAFRVLIMWSYM